MLPPHLPKYLQTSRGLMSMNQAATQGCPTERQARSEMIGMLKTKVLGGSSHVPANMTWG